MTAAVSAMNDSRIYTLWLSLALGGGNAAVYEALKRFETPENAYYMIAEERSTAFLSARELKSCHELSLDSCKRLADYCILKGIGIVTLFDEDYPKILMDIYNPPLTLYYRGDITILNSMPAFAVVGARETMVYTQRLTERISGELAASGMCIVSGFAVGTDTAAHTAAIRAGGKTAAVLGCGIDVDYPKGTLSFRTKIAEGGGVVISEYPPGTKPSSPHFPVRNRIISGLSLGVMVTQASGRSGALNTAAAALAQGRDVFCVPPADIYDEAFAGNITLLREGAIPVFGYKDILYEYCSSYSHKLSMPNPLTPYIAKEDSFLFSDGDEPDEVGTAAVSKISAAGEKKQKRTLTQEELSSLDAEQASVVSLLADGRMHIDELSQRSGIEIGDLTAVLTELEIYGYIQALAGNSFELADSPR